MKDNYIKIYVDEVKHLPSDKELGAYVRRKVLSEKPVGYKILVFPGVVEDTKTSTNEFKI